MIITLLASRQFDTVWLQSYKPQVGVPEVEPLPQRRAAPTPPSIVNAERARPATNSSTNCSNSFLQIYRFSLFASVLNFYTSLRADRSSDLLLPKLFA